MSSTVKGCMSKSMKRTGAQIIWETLTREGVEVVFGYPGGAIMPVYDAMLGYKIHHVLVRHEQGAAPTAAPPRPPPPRAGGGGGGGGGAGARAPPPARPAPPPPPCFFPLFAGG